MWRMTFSVLCMFLAVHWIEVHASQVQQNTKPGSIQRLDHKQTSTQIKHVVANRASMDQAVAIDFQAMKRAHSFANSGCSSVGVPRLTGSGIFFVALFLVLAAIGRITRRKQWWMGTACLLLAMLNFESPARASMVRWLDLPSMTAGSQLVITGRVIAQSSAWQGKIIYTTSVVSIENCLKGRCEQREIAVSQIGGKVGEYGMYVDGVTLLQPSSRVLLFLYASHNQIKRTKQNIAVHRIVGLAQGHFQFTQRDGQDLLVSDRSGLELVKDITSPQGKPPLKIQGTKLTIPASIFFNHLRLLISRLTPHTSR